MIIEQPPILYRLFFPGALWRLPQPEKTIYLTFDDGPIPEITPWVLEVLKEKGILATFFCVGDNVRKYPEIFEMVRSQGHAVGNHTFHHLQGFKVSTRRYLRDTMEAHQLISSRYFRPPHGHMRLLQYLMIRRHFKIVMWDVVTRDYSNRLTPDETLGNIKRYVRNGSIIVFHDSLKSEANMKYALPRAIDYLKQEGYAFSLLPEVAL